MSAAAPMFRLARPNVDAKVGHAVLERRGFAAVFVVVVEHRPLIDVVVLERDELAFRRRAEPDALLCARPVTDRLEHHLAADHEFDRLAELPRRGGGERTLRPWPQLAAETRANKFA